MTGRRISNGGIFLGCEGYGRKGDYRDVQVAIVVEAVQEAGRWEGYQRDPVGNELRSGEEELQIDRG